MYPIAITGDIKKTYLQISVDKKDRIFLMNIQYNVVNTDLPKLY